MKLTKRALDRLDLTIEATYGRDCKERGTLQINMLEIGRIFSAARNAATPHILRAKNIDIAMQEAATDITHAVATTIDTIITEGKAERTTPGGVQLVEHSNELV
jgi:urease gamma subunit